MKKILLSLFIFFVTLSAKGTLYTIVVPLSINLTNLCPGDTIRFSGDSLNQWIYGTIVVTIENSDSALNQFCTITSDSNVATTCDHIVTSGDIWYFLTPFIASGFFTFNCFNSISKYSLENTYMRIFPNPSSENILIASNQDFCEINIFDMTGHSLIQKKTNTTKETLNISSFEKGIYLVEINTTSGSVFKKLIKN